MIKLQDEDEKCQTRIKSGSKSSSFKPRM